MIELTQIEAAYRKLKSYAYYNRNDLHLTADLCAFEAGDVEKAFERLRSELVFFDIESPYWTDLLRCISIYRMPKQLEPAFGAEQKNFVSNVRVEPNYEITRTTAFIRAPIELLLCNVLWLLGIGSSLDSQFRPCAFGNRLSSSASKRNQSLYLFKPYPEQYKKWRDGALDHARQLLTEGTSVALINLDIQDYYSSVRYSSAELRKDIHFDDLESDDQHLHLILERLHETYSSLLLRGRRKGSSGNPLPIGLMSSSVLGNAYLLRVDEIIEDTVRPAYYARYVDDIAIVIRNPKPPRKVDGVDPVGQMLEEYLRGAVSRENEEFRLTERPELRFQAAKTLLLHFDASESTAVLDSLRQDIIRRSSEYRFMSDSQLERTAFENEAYELIFDGTQGKLRTLKDYREDRYGLSVFLSRQIQAALKYEGSSKRSDDALLRFFRGRNCILYHSFWEKVLSYFTVTNNGAAIRKFVTHTREQIQRIMEQDHAPVRQSLLEHLFYSCAISLALNPSTSSKALDRELRTLRELAHLTADLNTSAMFRQSNFIRHEYVGQPLLNYTALESTSLVRRSFPYEEIKRLGLSTAKDVLDVNKFKYSPRRVKFYEVALLMVHTHIAIQGSTIVNNWEEEYLSDAKELYMQINYGQDASSFHLFEESPSIGQQQTHNRSFVISNDTIDKARDICLGNIVVDSKQLLSSLRGTPIRSAVRERRMDDFLKDAAKSKSDVVVLPENCVPHDLSWMISQHSWRYNQCLVAGLEHLNVASTVYNLLLVAVPIRINGLKDCLPVIRLKNHYSPEETHQIRGYNFSPAMRSSSKRYDIFYWGNLVFSVFYCFELANAVDRAAFRSRLDLLICCEYNRDIPYFSSIVESTARDLHTIVCQVNSSDLGDSRVTLPSKREHRDLLRITGGKNTTVLVAGLPIDELRDFQLQLYSLQKDSKTFKPTPPEFDIQEVHRRLAS